MTDPYNSSKTTLLDNVVELKFPDKRIEHVDSTTIVERAITPEERAEFLREYEETINGRTDEDE